MAMIDYPNTLAGDAEAYHVGALVWAPIKDPGVRDSLDASNTGRNTVKRWVKGKVASIAVGSVTSLTVDTTEGVLTNLKPSDCPLRNERDDTVDDLVKSDFLHEPGILHTLSSRYQLDLIYTYSGSILIAVNPHKRLRNLYGQRMMNQYKGVPLGELSPHVYAVAEQAFSAMTVDNQRQAILISGESGAGKTETAKMVMQFLANRQAVDLQRFDSTRSEGGDSAPIEHQVLESNPLLEAFGNAKTTRNNNSSRFGKWAEMYFDAFGKVTGASISTYLLERSRVVSINSPERSFHIFYQLCTGATPEQQKQLRLDGGVTKFRYLVQSECLAVDQIDDEECFRETVEAMNIIGLTSEEQDNVFSIVAAVLHLGNISFAQDENDGARPDGPQAEEAIANVAHLLQVDVDGLRKALMTREIRSVGETIVKQLDASAAAESRDSLAKILYARLFDWLVAAINRKISAVGSGTRTNRTIGILDIYGFESFKENSFEQLCINLANEKLQQQFNSTVFKSEQEEYAREGIDWSYIKFVDNQECLDVLEGVPEKTSLGVFPLIDEACRLPRATYQDLAHTLRTRLADHPRFVTPKRPQHWFIIDHYAGMVPYSSEFLLDKNKDFIIAEHLNLLSGSNNSVVYACFAEEAAANATSASSFKFNSLGGNFRKQLQGLMNTLNECRPHYIRCIKPNPQSQPGSLVPEYSLEQLRAGGVLEAVRIACAGFPTRKEFLPFVERYALLLSHGQYQPRDWLVADFEELVESATKVLQMSKLSEWQIGKTRVFLRAGQLAKLEGARGRRVTTCAVRIQAAYKGLLTRRKYLKTREQIILVQSAWRGYCARKRLQQMRRERAALVIQSCVRMYKHRKVFLHHKRTKAAIVIQSYVRMHLARQHFIHETEAGKRAVQRKAAAVVIQSFWRRLKAIKQFQAMLAEARKWKLLQEERDALEVESCKWRANAESSDRKVSEMEAIVARLRAELDVAKVYQSKVQTLEAEAEQFRAQEAARKATMQELQLLREQKHKLEAANTALNDQVTRLSQQAKSYKSELDETRDQADKRENEIRVLKKQVGQAREHNDVKSASRDGTIAALRNEVTCLKQQLTTNVDAAKKQAKVEANNQIKELQSKLNELKTKTESDSDIISTHRQRCVVYSVKMVALKNRVQKLDHELAQVNQQKEAYKQEATQRQTALERQLEAAEKIASRIMGNGITSSEKLTKSRPTSPLIELPAISGPDGTVALEKAGIERSRAQLLCSVLHLATHQMLPIIPIKYSERMIGVPGVAWPLGNALFNWLTSWPLEESRILTVRLRDSILTNAKTDGLQSQVYWLTTCLAMGQYMRITSIGHLSGSSVFKTADDLIHFTQLQGLMASTVANVVPVDLTPMTSEKKRRSVETGLARTASLDPGLSRNLSQSADAIANMSLAELEQSQWKSVLGGLSNVVEIASADNRPPSVVRAIVLATLCYIDATLMNALMLRRDCCSIEAVKALQMLLIELKVWMHLTGKAWNADGSDVEKGCEYCYQAVSFLLRGKDELAAKAAKGADILPDLRRNYNKLSLEQLYKLAEQHHDEWTTGSTSTITLLQVLKAAMDSGTTLQDTRVPVRSHSVRTAYSFSSLSEDEEGPLILDFKKAFVLPRRLLVDAGKEMLPRDKMEVLKDECRAHLSQHMEGVKLMATLDL